MRALMLALLLQLGHPKEVKIYVNVPDHGSSEMFSMHLQTWMRMLDEEDNSYRITWIPKASEAEFILTIVMDRDKDTGKYMAMTHLWRKNSSKAFDMLNQQLNRDPDEIAKNTAKVLELAMGLKKSRD